jgi:hypothetical protein
MLMLLGSAVSVQAHTLSPNQYLIWGIAGEDIEIPAGSIITEAVLTIHDFIPAKARFNLHLLDNAAAGVQMGTQDQAGNIFAGFGVPLTGTATGGKWVCRLSQVNQVNSPMWDIYGYPFLMPLTNGSTVSLSSSLLELIDYIGNGGGFGFGFDFTDVCTFTQITLDITAKTYVGDYQEQVYSFQISQMYEYDPVSGTWVYQDGEGESEWEAEQDPYLPLTVTSCQVTAGKILGQDTLSVAGTFNRVHPNLFSISSIGVEIVSVADEVVIYSQDCAYTWDTVRNRFTWTYKVPKNQPGQITALTLDFTAMTFAMTVTSVDLTGLSCPIRFDITLGSYILTGEAGEPVINGVKQIPIRMMRDYQDQMRIIKATVKKGKIAGADQLIITGEIAVANLDTNLTAQEVIINWGDQAFTIPAGTFTLGKKANMYSCKATVPGGMMVCMFDFDRCIFSVKLSQATLDVTSGAIEFRMRFAAFDQAVDLNL